MSDKASKDMQENNVSSDVDNISAAEGLEEEGSTLMSEVLEAVNESAEDSELQSEKNEELEKLKQELAATQDKYLRTLADFENFKKRTLKERSDLMKYQGEPIVQDLLRVFDDLDLALQFSGQAAEGSSESADPKKFVEGVQMIHKNLVDILGKWQIRSESAVGMPFDPHKHMAISKVSLADTAPGTVVSELKKVYFYKDKILRVAEVIVAAE